MNLKTLVVINSVTLVLMLFFNYASNSGLISDTTVGDISYKYDTLFAPAGYAFSIWGLIFLGAIAFVAFQWYSVNKPALQPHIERTGWWFTIGNIANSVWIYCWLNEWLGLSVLVIFVLLAGLIALTLRLRLELDDAPVQTIFFVWWPIAIYLGWIMVASIACVAAWLTSIEFAGTVDAQAGWTIALIIIATIIYIYLIFNRNLREAAVVGIWAFIAIAVRQAGDQKLITITAIACAVVLLTLISYHAFKNRHYNIGSKLNRNEWGK